MNFWESPLKEFEANKVSVTDYINKEHYQEAIRKRFTYNASSNLFEHYVQMKLDVYVFSEKELSLLLTRRK